MHESMHDATRASSFHRLHGRGRSVSEHDPHRGRVASRAEPLCAPSPEFARETAPQQATAQVSGGVGSNAGPANFEVPSQPAIRLGMRMVRGLEPEEAHRIVDAVAREGPFTRLRDLFERSGVRAATLRRLAAADAFRSMGLDRQQASWQILALRDRERPLWSIASQCSSMHSDTAQAERVPTPPAPKAPEDAPHPEMLVSGMAESNATATSPEPQGCEHHDLDLHDRSAGSHGSGSLDPSHHNPSHHNPSHHSSSPHNSGNQSSSHNPRSHGRADSSAAAPHTEDFPPPHLEPDDLEPNLPDIPELAGIARDFESTGVTLRRHPLACLRDRLQRMRAVPCGFLRDERRMPAGRLARVAGIVLVRQKPSTAKGIVFVTIEDESGIANLIVRPKVYERLRPVVRNAGLIFVQGKVERRDGVVHVLVQDARDLTTMLSDGALRAEEGGAVSQQSRDFH
jgi:DNA polymerase III alpha subunit